MDWMTVGIGAGTSAVNAAIAGSITALVGGNVILVTSIVGVTAFIIGTGALAIVKVAGKADEAYEQMMTEINE